MLTDTVANSLNKNHHNNSIDAMQADASDIFYPYKIKWTKQEFW